MVMKSKINEDFKESYLDFLNSLKKDKPYTYFPVKKGNTEEGKKWAINQALISAGFKKEDK